MKKFIYFSNSKYKPGQLEEAINDVTSQRDNWLKGNNTQVVIDNEDLKITTWTTTHLKIMVVLQLTYYEQT